MSGSPGVRFCPTCGTEATEGARFCSGCGQPLPTHAPVPATPGKGRPRWWWAALGLGAAAAAALVVVLLLVLAGGGGGVASSTSAAPGSGAEAVLADGSVVSGVAAADAGEAPPGAGIDHAVRVGDPFLFPSQDGPATVALPFDANRAPGRDPVVFAAFYDEEADWWVPLPGEVDPGAGRITVAAGHLSWWAAWAWDLDALGGALAEGLEDFLAGSGLPPAAPPGCGETPEGVRVSAEGAPLLAACAEATGGDLVRVRVGNAGGQGLVLALSESAAQEEGAGGLLPDWLAGWMTALLPADAAYLAPGGEDSLLVDLSGGNAVLASAPTPATLVADFLLTACRASNGVCAAVGEAEATANCLLAGIERAGTGGTFTDLAAAAGRCTAEAVPGSEAVFAAMGAAAGADRPIADWMAERSSTLGILALPPGAFEVEEADACVVGVEAGEALDVHSGPGAASDTLGTLAQDATGVATTGWAVQEADRTEWRQIHFDDGTPWVLSDHLTPGACSVGEPAEYCVVEAACDDPPNIRLGLGTAYRVIGTLAVEATGVLGTGATALDTRGRTWVQVEHDGGVGWVAGWLLDPAPCSAASCAGHPLVVHPDGIGSWEFGDPTDEVRAGLISRLGPPDGSVHSEWGPWDWVWWDQLDAAFGTGTEADTGFRGYEVGVTTSRPPVDWITPEGIAAGSTLAELQAAYPAGGEEFACYPMYYSSWEGHETGGAHYRFYLEGGVVFAVGAGQGKPC